MERKYAFREVTTKFFCSASGVFWERIVLVLCFIFVFCAGGSHATEASDFDRYDTHVALHHHTHAFMVDGRADYRPSVFGAAAPRYSNVVIVPFINWYENVNRARIRLSSDGLTGVAYYDAGSGNYIQEMMVREKIFDIRYNNEYNYHYISDSAGREAEFRSGAERSFSGQSFTLSISYENFEGRFPNVKTTAEQMQRCVPYIELITDGELTTGFRWRFVNPARPGVALTRSSTSNISAIDRFRLRVAGQFVYVDNSRIFRPGDALEGVVVFDSPHRTANIGNVRFSFVFADSFTSNAYARYFWTFFPIFSRL